jgi:hypothetical protein
MTAAKRRALPKTSFALPGRRYPIDTRGRGANALARCTQHCTPSEKPKVHAAVCRRYPSLPSCQRRGR